MKKIGFYDGSFDPFTKGHLHVVKVSSEIFDEVVIGIGINPAKEKRFSTEVMLNAIEKTLKTEALSNVRVISYDNLSVTAAIENNANFLIRGIRNGMDYDFEETLDTIYVRAGEVGPINSTMIMDFIRNNADLTRFLPKDIIEAIKK